MKTAETGEGPFPKVEVVKIAPDVEHWHGAMPHGRFAHLAITTNPERGSAVWLEPVDDDYYEKLE